MSEHILGLIDLSSYIQILYMLNLYHVAGSREGFGRGYKERDGTRGVLHKAKFGN